MVFTDLLFLFCFLPISVLLYKVTKNIKIQNILLVVLSLLFYAWGNPVHVILLILSILWNYFTALELNEQKDEKARKIILIVAIVVNLLLLGVYQVFKLHFQSDFHSLPLVNYLTYLMYITIRVNHKET